MTLFPEASSRALGSFIAAGALVCALVAQAETPFTPDQIAFFEKNVRPVLAENCYECHGPAKQKNGLRLDSRDAILKGSEYNKVVVPGDPEASILIKAVRHAAGPEPMPSKKPQLVSNQIEALTQWIKMGLPWPKETTTAGEAKPKWQEHWAFQPVRKPVVPQTSNPVDALVAAKLQAAKLDFAPPADAATLCRRLYVGLTGLPPTFEQVQAFVNDSPKEPIAFEHTIAAKRFACVRHQTRGPDAWDLPGRRRYNECWPVRPKKVGDRYWQV